MQEIIKIGDSSIEMPSLVLSPWQRYTLLHPLILCLIDKQCIRMVGVHYQKQKVKATFWLQGRGHNSLNIQ